MSPQQHQLACQTECLFPTAQAEGPERCCMPPREADRLQTPTNQDKGRPRRSSSGTLGYRKVK